MLWRLYRHHRVGYQSASTNNRGSKVINAALHVKPELTTQYEAFIHELVVNSSQEPGNGFYGHFKQLGHDHDYEIIEHWQDQAAVDFHNKTPHFQNFLAHINEYLITEPEITRMDH
ncbi:putative quinol monooxygenase [Lactiplantibacillus plantarum]|uniref:putative quinol monooxygenase n=1 Tax=Lactiplantibacillus plantarum TaxID=1590 RepID=UPI00402BCC78